MAIEIDGQYHHEKNQIELDEERTMKIQLLRLVELRFSNHEVLCRLDLVIKSIENHVNS